MQLKKVRDLEPVKVPPPHARELRTVYSPEQDPQLAGDFTMFRLTIYPHSSSDRHSHSKSGEVMFVLSGNGVGVLDDESMPLTADTAFYAPPGVLHQVLNQEDVNMELICIFAPAVGTAYARAKAAETH